MLISSLPGLVLLVLPGLGRAFGAVFLRETGGSAPVTLAFDALRAFGALRERRDRSFVPLTRSAFWERLGRADEVEALSDGTFVFRGLLPHLTWGGGRRLFVGQDFWSVAPEPPVLSRGRLVYSYRVEPLGEPVAPGEPGPAAPPKDAYAEEVLAQVRREWDALNEGFAWLTSMLPADVQARAFDHRGGPRGRSSRDGRHGGGHRRPRSLRAELPARAAGRPTGPVPGSARRRARDRRGAADPGDAPGSLRAEPLPLPAALGLAPPGARRLARPPRRRARGARSNWSDQRPARFGFLKRLQIVGFIPGGGSRLVYEQQ